MNIKGFSAEEIAENVEELVFAGHDEGMAASISFTLARRAFKNANPDKGLPEHLSGGCMAVLRKTQEKLAANIEEPPQQQEQKKAGEK